MAQLVIPTVVAALLSIIATYVLVRLFDKFYRSSAIGRAKEIIQHSKIAQLNPAFLYERVLDGIEYILNDLLGFLLGDVEFFRDSTGDF